MSPIIALRPERRDKSLAKDKTACPIGAGAGHAASKAFRGRHERKMLA
jgi:hypothetical protein